MIIEVALIVDIVDIVLFYAIIENTCLSTGSA